MVDDKAALEDFKPTRELFVGIDSDGCAFDSMELKHKECFCPNFINYFELQAVSKYARESWDFVNLYSSTRGCNRFLALIYSLDWLRQRPEVVRRGVRVVRLEALEAFNRSGKPLSNPSLEQALKERPDPQLELCLKWSQHVNRDVKRFVHDVPPFPNVRECLERLAGKADMMVVSATPGEALRKEWQEHDIDRYVALILGQEIGSKSEMLAAAAPHYPKGRMLMVGDAPGDYKAAKANGALFFPVVPGEEEASWEILLREGIDRFLAGTYAGAFEERLTRDFLAKLPDKPPWKR
jgi:phosphoglycolate phosphatase-like HAD superfamily hydrolase